MSLRPLLLALSCTSLLAGCQATTPARGPANPADEIVAVPPPPPTPLEQARARGMAFRAVGENPAWSIEVDKSRMPTLFLTLPGSEPVKIAQSTPFSDPTTGTLGFRGTTATGEPITLSIQRGQCPTYQIGSPLVDAAQLQVGNRQYLGCGRFLF